MELGAKVIFNKKYKKEEVRTEDGYLREWSEVDIKEIPGVFVGIRVLKNIDIWTTCDEDGYENGIDYKISKNIKVALIAINKRGTLYVPLDCL